jgi:superfamily II DNA/RNA helicase
MILTNYHARLFAHQITRQTPAGAEDSLSMSLFDASVDLNPHQIEAALFALQSPLSKGVILADEVGLGKTIEAGIVLCQKWAERKRRLVIICPAAIRQQWANELKEKFNLPAFVLDAKTYKELRRDGHAWPLEQKAVVITSYHYAARLQDELRAIEWDLVVIDEAHKLRNAYRPSNRLGQSIRWATEGRKKLLLTATPLQNSLLELYGLSTLIDEDLFGDQYAFRAKYMNAGGSVAELRGRLAEFCKRTLRRQVMEYVRYTARHAITQPFFPSDAEQELYDLVTKFLEEEGTYSVPERQRHLTVLIMRKLLASSSVAIAGTLSTMKARLEQLRNRDAGDEPGRDILQALLEDEEFEPELIEEWEAEGEEVDGEIVVHPVKLRKETEEIAALVARATAIETDSKTYALKQALDIGFAKQAEMGAKRKALIFTESRRTQDYLKLFLEQNGYNGKIVSFSGTNAGDENHSILEHWSAANAGTGKATGSRAIDMRSALIDYFRDEADIMIATEAAAEGVNLQFCSMVINYDLPWNPQRIEQRIGRCHRYGQSHDVIVINFLNERNAVDMRVHELLRDKFKLFDGVFGASDEVLGAIESGVDFERRILAIYEKCRTEEEIQNAFDELQSELEVQITSRMDETRAALIEHFDEDVHSRLKLRLDEARIQLDRISSKFWDVTNHVLNDAAVFDTKSLTFDLSHPPSSEIQRGRYHLISKIRDNGLEANAHGSFLYRLSHPLGEHVLDAAKALPTPTAELHFDVSGHTVRNTVMEEMRGRSGWLTLDRLTISAFEDEEHLLLSGMDDDGRSLDTEICEKMFSIGATVARPVAVPDGVAARIKAGADRLKTATLNHASEVSSKHFAIAREKLEQWAEDKIYAAERALKDTKELIRAMRRQARNATTVEEESEAQKKIQELERKQRKQRQEIFDVEDEIAERRDDMIDALQKRMHQRNICETLFTIRWSVV